LFLCGRARAGLSRKLGPLPRLYVAREKLAVAWNHRLLGQRSGREPFFVVTQPIHAGLIEALRQWVIPRLLAEAPQRDAAQLAARSPGDCA